MKKYIILPLLLLGLFVQAQKKVIFSNATAVSMTVYEVASRDTAGGFPKFIGQASAGAVSVTSTYTMSPTNQPNTKFPYLYLHGPGAYFDSWVKYVSGGGTTSMSGTTAFADAAAPSQIFDYVSISVNGGAINPYGLGSHSVGGYTLTVTQGGSGSSGTTNVDLF